MSESSQTPMETLLALLTARDEVTLTDVNRQEYVVNTVLSARRQLAVLQEIRVVFDAPELRSAFARIQESLSQSGGLSVGLLDVVATAGEPGLVALDRICAVAYPDLPAPATEHFAVEEVLGGVLPFFARAVKAAQQLSLGPAAPTA